MMRWLTRVALMTLLCEPLLSAGAPPGAGAVPPASSPDYSKEAAVIEYAQTRIDFDADASSIVETESRTRIRSAAGVQQAGTIVIPYGRESTTFDELSVRVIKSDGSIVQTDPRAALDVPTASAQQMPMYSDIYERRVNVQGLAVGDVMEVPARIRHRSLLPPNFWFAHDFADNGIVLDERLTVSVPATLAVRARSRGIQPSMTTESGRRVYTWQSSSRRTMTEDEIAVAQAARLKNGLTSWSRALPTGRRSAAPSASFGRAGPPPRRRSRRRRPS